MKFTPHAYQTEAIEKILTTPSVGLFLDMGLGKTVITLTAIQRLIYERFAARKVLIIAPKTVAEATWTAEARRWDHLSGLRISVVLGTLKKRQKALQDPADIYVINRENVVWLVETLGRQWDFDTVVLDESTSFKNSASRRFRAMRSVRGKVSRVIALTGTPAPNGMEDLWAQMFLLDGGVRLGRSLTAYREAFFTQDYVRPGQMFRKYSLRPGADKTILRLISDICVSMKAEDYLTLPEFIESTVPVALDPHARDQYDQLQKEFLLDVGDGEITAQSAAVLNGKLLQLCSGAVYRTDGKAETIHTAKLDACMELLEQLHGEHALIFYWFQHERDSLLEALKKAKLRARVYTDARDAEAWNSGSVDVLLAHPASCGYGLNLQHGGRHIVWYGYPNWNLELYQQANKRLHRQGQQMPVICHHLAVIDGMDETVLEALHSKGDAQAEVMKTLKAKIQEARS